MQKNISIKSLLSLLVLFVMLNSVPSVNAEGIRFFRAQMFGFNEVPPIESATVGWSSFFYDSSNDELVFRMAIFGANGIFGGPGAHIHCGAPGENGPVAAFLAGGLDQGLHGTVRTRGTLRDSNVAPTSCGSTIAELVQAMRQGNTYVNVHSNNNPAGEIRGQIRLRLVLPDS